MTTIVRMPAPRARPSRAAEAETGATILFFTGVRYVRDEEDSLTDDEASALAEVESRTDAESGVLAAV